MVREAGGWVKKWSPRVGSPWRRVLSTRPIGSKRAPPGTSNIASPPRRVVFAALGFLLVVNPSLGCTAATATQDRAPAAISEVSAHGRPPGVPPPWMNDAVLYGAILGKFGGFKGLQAHLDRLQGLGVNTLWLSPLNPSPEGDFGYAVNDYFDVRPEYGTKQDFRELVEAAHARGMRVLIDFVPNHTSDRHPFFLSAQAKGKASPYYDFYDRDDEGNPTHYFDWEHLPNLEYDNPEVDDYIIDAFQYWVREFDVDGFRADAAWAVKERDPQFWPEWRAALTAAKPDLLLIAEAGARDPYYAHHGFDAAYDWSEELGRWAWEGAFDDPETTAIRLREALTTHGEGYGPKARVVRFIENNDTGRRFITRHGVDITKLAATLSFTVPGIPTIYTGQEVGAEYHPYEDDFAPIDWSQDPHDLQRFYRTLAELRRDSQSLKSGAFELLEVEPANDALAYLRYAPEAPGAEPVLVVLNFGAGKVASLRLPSRYRDAFAVVEGLGNSLASPLEGESHPARWEEGRLQITLGPREVEILKGRGAPRTSSAPWAPASGCGGARRWLDCPPWLAAPSAKRRLSPTKVPGFSPTPKSWWSTARAPERAPPTAR